MMVKPALAVLLMAGAALVTLGEHSRRDVMPAQSGAAAVATLRRAGLYGSLESAIRRARYQVAATQPAGDTARRELSAANPAQSLAVRFTPAALELTHVEPGANAGANGGQRARRARRRVGVALAGIGRGATRASLTAGPPAANGNRVEAVHRDVMGRPVTEWFVNDTAGLEQGFVLSAPPTGPHNADVTLALRVDGDLTPEVAGGGDCVMLRDANGAAILRYEGLKAWDALGRKLASRMRPGECAGEIVLEVSDLAAQYPITIDPTWVQEAEFTGSDSANGDRFGNAIALDGDTAVVGSFLDNTGATDAGCAFVFTRSGATWTQQAKLTASDAANADEFGTSVGLSGNTAIIGAPLDNGAAADMGSAYVYVRSGVTWTQQAKLTASDGALSDELGFSVDVDGDTAVVGAHLDDVGANSNQGSVYVFLRTGVAWAQQAKITASDGAAGDRLGYSVSLQGDDLIGGAYLDNAPATDQGSAYVFVRSGVVWSEQQRLTASDGANGDQFGWSVAIDEDTAIVGANEDDIGANADQGSAYTFVRSGVLWSQQSKLTASDGAASDNFGWSVSVDAAADLAVVGAALDDGANSDQGSAYTFVRSGVAWTEQQKLSSAAGVANAHFGSGVAVEADTVVVGAERQNSSSPAGVNNGTVYIYRLMPDPPVITNVAATAVGKTTATISWTTDVPSSSTVEYGLTNAFGSTAIGGAGTNHTVSLAALTPGRTYHFRVRSTTTGGTAPTSESVSPGGGSLLLVTAPDVGVVAIGFAMRRLAGTIYVTVTVTNTSGSPVTDAILNSATLRGTSTGSPSAPILPLNMGVIGANSSVTTTLEFSGGLGVAGASGVLNFGFESSDGSIGVGYRSVLP